MSLRGRGIRAGTAIVVAVLGAGLLLSGTPGWAAQSATQKQNDLLIGYKLLSGALSAEAQLKYLLWLRELTLQGPAKEVERLMTTIYEASTKRSDELEKLRALRPATTAAPPPSPIGNAIQEAAQWDGTKEMLFPNGEFGVRFVILQAQATRMISVIANQTAEIDPNGERQKWLKTVSKDYESYREQLVRAVEKCDPR